MLAIFAVEGCEWFLCSGWDWLEIESDHGGHRDGSRRNFLGGRIVAKKKKAATKKAAAPKKKAAKKATKKKTAKK